MQDFTRPSGRLRALPVTARVVYTIFLLFTLLGLALTLALTHDMVGLDLSRASQYYGGEAPPTDDPELEGGPALIIPPDGAELAVYEPMSRRKLLEITHFHLFSMPVYLLILSHIYMLSRARKQSKAFWIAVGSVGTLLHVGAPWWVSAGYVGSVGVYATSGLMLSSSYAWMCLGPLWEMWRR